MKCIIITVVTIFAFGCGANSSPDATNASRQNSPTGTTVDNAASSAQTSIRQAQKPDQQSPNSAKMAIGPLLPRPIESEHDAQMCMAAAARFNREIAKHVGVASANRTVRLEDCVIDYDEDNSGWIKFYPDGTRVRLYLRGQHAADLNVFKKGVSRAVIHVTVDDFDNGMVMIYANYQNPDGSETIKASYSKSSDSAEFEDMQRGDWDKIADPDTLKKFCSETYNEIQSLRESQ